MKSITAALMFVLLAPAARVNAQERGQVSGAEPAKPSPAADKVPDRAQLEKRFAETMSGAMLVGHFSVEGRSGEPKEERYTIQKVTKQQGDTWLFLARIQFGGRDVTVPMLIPVKWAGDTAVITVTDVGFPGLGTYTARVLIYGNQYAGTWSGKDHGGHLWGRIERADKDTSGEPASPGGQDQKKGERP